MVITNSPASASYVATVPSACTLEPWPVSVIAKQPISFPVTRSEMYAAWCRSVPSWRIAPPKSPNWTPTFTSTDRSPIARVSKAASEAPMLPPPPYCSGKPIPVWPVAAISTTTSLTRSRNASWSRVSASSRIEAYSARLLRTRLRISAYFPSSSAVSAGTSMVGWT